jgi:hypothetical protein
MVVCGLQPWKQTNLVQHMLLRAVDMGQIPRRQCYPISCLYGVHLPGG